MIFGPYKKGDTFYGIIILYLGKIRLAWTPIEKVLARCLT